MEKTRPVLSIIIPVYNESDNIDWFYKELSAILQSTGKSYEFVYVNDGSKDNTSEKIQALAKKDSHVVFVCLARNFGKEAATSAGLYQARGKAAIILDGDGQHPPEKIPFMIKRWEKGIQQVVGIRTSNKKAGLFKNVSSKLYYSISHLIGANNVIPNATDFRLIDREIIDTFNNFTERKRMTRALLDWSGYITEYMPFEARERSHGVAVYTFHSLVRLAFNGYIGSTLKPLYFIGGAGSVIASGSFILLLIALINRFCFADVLHLGVTGTAFIALFVTFLVGLLMVAQGIVAAYIANIQLEAQNRPLYIINKAKSVLR